jgi:ribosomal-protein-alanine N-acetyltransferase
MIRLDRGGADFLESVTRRLLAMGNDGTYSPALYPGSSRVWRRAGYQEFAQLAVMERTLAPSRLATLHPVEATARPDWDQVTEVDRLAFDGFWRMGSIGLVEAFETNKESVVLTTARQPGLVDGFVIVGCQWGVAYLHRIAVRPEAGGQGLGASLLSATMTWAYGMGARTIVLNVRHENQPARDLYRRAGFSDTRSNLLILRHDRG